MFMDLEEQYDKIYRYCYFKVHHKEIAEDITQETFLRFFASEQYQEVGKALPYLYTIARNLCIDEFRKRNVELLMKDQAENLADENKENTLLTSISIQMALEKLTEEEKELLLLRYVNEVPISVICKLFQMSRYAIYRKLKRALEQLKKTLRREDFE